MLLALAYVLLLAVVALLVPLANSTADRVDAEVRSQARGQADVVAASAADLLPASPGDRDDLDRLVDTAARSVRGRVLITDARGRLLADSGGTPLGTPYASRPEIAAALRGAPDQRERRSTSLDETLLATSVPVLRDGRPAGAVRVTQSVAAVDRAVRRSWVGLALVGLLVVGLGLLVGALIANGIVRPVTRLDRAARQVADGDLEARAPVEGSAEQRSLARTFNEMTARLSRLLGAQREFVADASHQLRTPLAGLRLRIEEARAESDQPAVKEELDGALSEVDRLAQMVAELLELSRAGEHELPAEPVDLADAARRAARRFGPEAAKRGRSIEARGDDAQARATPADVDRVVDALVENALRYSPPGATVTITARGATILVEDDGPGIDPAEADAVFDRFHRGTVGRQGPAGTGLGLPIARELARRWGGDVTLRPRPEGGTVAEVRLSSAGATG